MVKKFKGKIYGLATVGERGQIVIPQEARTALGIKPKDRLVVSEFGPGSGLIIFKAEALDRFLSQQLEHLSSLRKLIKEVEK